ncbi:MAG: hypothetical protein LC674_00270 [Actinobacteria bacterium]|nr:hypothetical protein [Actinomycetota bacterium]
MSVSDNSSTEPVNPDEKETPSEISFHLIKGNLFRVIYVEGVYGGVTPRGDFRVAVFNERLPLPDTMFQRITPEGKLGDEITERRAVRKGIVREIEADLVMNYGTAKVIHKWLGEKIEAFEKTLKETLD